MGDPRGFIQIQRADPGRRPVQQRLRDWNELYHPLPDSVLTAQGARCMDCGVPFCQGNTGCPLQNVIPDWNDLVFRQEWREALVALHATNNFPEFTGRLCPAPCESACVLGLIDQPVAIRHIEQTIIERGFDAGWVQPIRPARETGKTIAIIGSGPAGLAAAQQLRRRGHGVTVYEQTDRIGGLLRYGIPEFKMEKSVLDRRLAQLEAEGVVFRTNTRVGADLTIDELQSECDAICLAIGAGTPRNLDLPGRELPGIHYAMDYLTQQNRILHGDVIGAAERITAEGKRVVVIGGGDTGSDCVGTALRQGAAEVLQFELLPEPPRERAASTPWPLWPMQLRTSHAHEEGGQRQWSVSTIGFSGDDRVRALHAVRVQPQLDAHGRTCYQEVSGSAFQLEVGLVILALGFTGPVHAGLLQSLSVQIGERGNIEIDADHMTTVPGVFAAGDAQRGQSLIVWAIHEGRLAAAAIDRWLRRS